MANLKLREQLRAESIRDPLTNLFNRRHMEESLDREISRALRSNKPLSIIMIDLDRPKSINDTYGHVAGDVALKELSSFCKAVCAPATLFAGTAARSS